MPTAARSTSRLAAAAALTLVVAGVAAASETASAHQATTARAPGARAGQTSHGVHQERRPARHRGHRGHGVRKNDPAGNNGTVKVAPYGAFDGIPNNTPHDDCNFIVEWYGFDQGADIVSDVDFDMVAPTNDVTLAVYGNTHPSVGGDAASGAGTQSGLDDREDYSLWFYNGTPQRNQGYHVKLTISTPGSHGKDTKSKVFWVTPCAEPQ